MLRMMYCTWARSQQFKNLPVCRVSFSAQYG